MKRLRAVLILLIAMAVVIIALVWVNHAQEPRYAGKPVSYWVGQFGWSGLDEGSGWQEKEALLVIKTMGTNAVPYLAAEAFNSRLDTFAATNFYKLLEHFPRSWHLPSLGAAKLGRDAAFDALAYIKPPASMVLPQIRQNLRSTNPSLRSKSLELCGALGDGAEEAVPLLMKALADPDPEVRTTAINSLGNLGPKSKAAVPALVKLLPNFYVIGALEQIGSNAAPALLPLKKLFFSETNFYNRCSLAATICQIDPHQDEAMSFLIQQLKTTTNEVQFGYVIHGLDEIGTSAQAAVPTLLDDMDSGSLGVSMSAASALIRIDPANERFLAKLKGMLKSERKDLRIEAASRSLELRPGDHEALSILLQVLRDRSSSEGREGGYLALSALRALVQAGPAANEMLPALRQIVIDHPDLYRQSDDMISQAIRHIEFRSKLEAVRHEAK